MKALTKKQLKDRDKITADLETAYEALRDAVDDYNRQILGPMWNTIQEHLERYNAVLDDARIFRDEVVGQIEDFMSDKSDKWQESDRGQAYDSWKSSWEDIALDDKELDAPEEVELEIDAQEDIDAINDLPVAVEA